jgi:membrane protease YdiL (CAAX protease family)
MKKLFFILALISILSFTLVAACQLSKAGFCAAIAPLYVYVGSGAIHLGLFSIAMFFLWKKDLKTTLSSIGVPGDLKRNAVFAMIGLCAIFSALFILGLVSIAVGFNDQQKVSERVMDLPLAILALAVLIAPVTEELFFRSFLSPRVGIILSSILFAIAHFSYGSVVEVVGVLFVGLLLGSIYRMSNSLLPCIAVHMAYNFLSIALMLIMGGKA